MLVGGLPNRLHYTHASAVADSALALLHASKKMKIPHLPDLSVNLRVGIHSGTYVYVLSAPITDY